MSDMIATTDAPVSANAVSQHEVAFLDVLGLYPQVNGDTGRSFLSVSGVTPDNHSGSFNINAPVEVETDKTKEWVDGLKDKLQSGYLEKGLRRVKISGGVWKHDLSKETGAPIFRQNGEACGSIRPASRAQKLAIDFRTAEPIPSSVEILY
jgi:hypothetical protein